MLDRAVVADFLETKLTYHEMEIPTDIPKEELVEAFCQYVEDDYYEWLKDNFNSFFDEDWDQPRKAIDKYIHHPIHEP